VVKHGGRAVSGKCGSADVLQELGVRVDRGPEWAQRCLDRFGFAFCYAPQFHDGLKAVSALRRTLGFRTLFNLVGPLANPAAADFQLLGVGDAALLDAYAAALARLTVRRAVVLHARDGLDEVSLAAATDVRIVEGDQFRKETWQPADFGLEAVTLNSIQATTARESSAVIRGVLANDDGPAARIVLANAAAALWTAGKVTKLKDGVELARTAVSTGKAAAILEQLIA
jgi:anthranilate phosphoribosyltransferase